MPGLFLEVYIRVASVAYSDLKPKECHRFIFFNLKKKRFAVVIKENIHIVISKKFWKLSLETVFFFINQNK